MRVGLWCTWKRAFWTFGWVVVRVAKQLFFVEKISNWASELVSESDGRRIGLLK